MILVTQEALKRKILIIAAFQNLSFNLSLNNFLILSIIKKVIVTARKRVVQIDEQDVVRNKAARDKWVRKVVNWHREII